MTVPVVYEPQGKGMLPSQHEMIVFHTMAEQAVTSKMYRGVGEQSGVLMIMLAAREMGIPPMAALNGGVNLINGKVEISARMMSAMIRRAGHSMQVMENTDTLCRIRGTRRDNGDTLVVDFHITDAQKACLVKAGGGWTKWPKDMLFARALSRLARQLFSDVIGIGYVEGEISETISRPQPDDEIERVTSSVVDIEVLDDVNERYKLMTDKIPEASTRELFIEYVDELKEHFGWTHHEAMKEVIDNPQAVWKEFEKWKKTKTT